METQLPRFFTILSAAWEHTKARFQELIIGIVLFLALSIAVQSGLKMENAPAIPGIGIILGILAFVISVSASLYYLIVVTSKSGDMGGAFSAIPGKFLPFIGLSLFVFLKTYLWIAILGALLLAGSFFNPALAPIAMVVIAIGFVCAIIFVPRYALSSVLWMTEGRGVVASVERSYTVTRGHYWNILINLIGLFLVSMVFVLALGLVATIIGGPVVKDAVQQLGTQCYSAFGLAFTVKLTEAILGAQKAKK